MASHPASKGYHHTQQAPLHWILYVCALVCFFWAWLLSEPPQSLLLTGLGLSLALTAPAFHHLTVEDVGESLRIRFGPVPVFRRSVPYRDIVRVETGRTRILDGWGIHYSLYGGWVWNIWGRDCVVLHLKRGMLRIGTDEPVELAAFLNRRLAESTQ